MYKGLCRLSGCHRGLFLHGNIWQVSVEPLSKLDDRDTTAQLFRGASSIARHDAEDAMMHCATAHNPYVVH